MVVWEELYTYSVVFSDDFIKSNEISERLGLVSQTGM